MSEIKLFNTLNKQKEVFKPIHEGKVGIYTCGPTVYNTAHIGNLRAYFFADLLKRVFLFNGYEVTHIMNVTDIGHLTSDADEGEDKMVKAIKREGLPMTLQSLRQVADTYFLKFKEDFKKLNLIEPLHFTFASEHISDQIRFIEQLKERGFVYSTSDGLYFNTAKLNDYGELGGTSDTDHSRIGINTEKKNPEDFALWKFASDQAIGFPSPFGVGFPGWHIECSAMSMRYLGEQFDIHTGGIDHISVHHNNEIAQGKALTGKLPAHYWIHNNHITIKGDKMAKSGENFLSLSFLHEQGISPQGIRMWYLQSRYSTRVDYSTEALQASETAWKKLRDHFFALGKNAARMHFDYIEKFESHVNDDLDTPKALTLVWELLRDEKLPNEDKKATLLHFDTVLAFGLSSLKQEETIIPQGVRELLEKRRFARQTKDWVAADHLRKQINDLGFEVKDQGEEQVVTAN